MADVDKHFAQFFNEYFIKYIQKRQMQYITFVFLLSI